ncbi:RpiB/LacA/LacB family sugar-phosphate isomerase [Candidatus Babeliales bacterium]|nr:RpiB/LacA/LacB family sugar-phosphate isomerase [Candidatus Babeliales bacterium]
MKIAIGSDHKGFIYKEQLIKLFPRIEWINVGCESEVYSDFPLYVKKVVAQIYNEKVEKGILLCGSGIGMTIAANRFKGIYAALAWNPESAKLSKQHNNSNILVIPTDFVSCSMAQEMIKVWLEAEFLGARYQERITMLDTF